MNDLHRFIVAAFCFLQIAAIADENLFLERVNAKEDFQKIRDVYTLSFLNAYEKFTSKQLNFFGNRSLWLNEAFDEEVKALNNSNSTIYALKAVIKDIVVGYISCEIRDNGTIYIRKLVVHPGYLRKKVATKLFNEAIKQITAIHKITKIALVTRKINTVALEFYKNLNFKKTSFTHVNFDPELYVGLEKSI